MSQQITLSDGKTIEIALLPLRSYGELLKTLQGTFKSIVSEWENLDENEIVAMLPVFIGDHLEDAAKIIEIGTKGQVTADELLDERGLADAITLLSAILTENDVNGIASSIKKATAAFKSRKTPAKSTDGQ